MTCHVLVVDDDDDLRESLGDALAATGHVVTTASDGAVALRTLEGGARPGLILLDLMMPVMDGYAFRAAQLADARWRDIPVVVLTAHADIAAIAAQLQPSAVHRKPIELRRLQGVVAEHCAGPAASS